MNLDPLTMKRLAFIRLLYRQGVDQSRLPEPLTFTSVLAFHDAVELFLILAGEHLGATLSDHIPFLKYWTELHPDRLAGGIELSGKVGMDRLNRIRNAFKHAGTMPGAAAIEQARADVSAFFEENSPKVFGVAFSRIDMADLVSDEGIRQLIKMAAQISESGDRRTAMAMLRAGFNKLFQSQGLTRGYQSPFGFGQEIPMPMQRLDIESLVQPVNVSRNRYFSPSKPRNFARQIEAVTDAVSAMQGGLRVISLGIDYGSYLRFINLTPIVYGQVAEPRQTRYPDGYSPNRDEFNYCHQFLIATALRVSEIRAQLVPSSWVPPHR
jgi:hypothetical protein